MRNGLAFKNRMPTPDRIVERLLGESPTKNNHTQKEESPTCKSWPRWPCIVERLLGERPTKHNHTQKGGKSKKGKIRLRMCCWSASSLPMLRSRSVHLRIRPCCWSASSLPMLFDSGLACLRPCKARPPATPMQCQRRMPKLMLFDSGLACLRPGKARPPAMQRPRVLASTAHALCRHCPRTAHAHAGLALHCKRPCDAKPAMQRAPALQTPMRFGPAFVLSLRGPAFLENSWGKESWGKL